MSALQNAELWWVDLVAAAPALHALEAHTPRLAAADEGRASALTDATVRNEWRAAHIALRLLIERAAGTGWRRVPLAREERGKPHLDGSPVAFSLSHAPGLALIGLAPHGRIGVDIERTRVVRIDAARRARIVAAAEALGGTLAGEEHARLLQAWVRLESFAKADGCGIGRLLTRLGILGRRSSGESDAGELAAALNANHTLIGVRDLDLGAGIFAAATFRDVAATTQVARLPEELEALQKLAN